MALDGREGRAAKEAPYMDTGIAESHRSNYKFVRSKGEDELYKAR